MRQLRSYSVSALKDILNTNKVIIFTDGASRGNPGPAAIGVVIQDETGKPIATISRRLGITTNNQAEYRAMVAALEKAISLGARQVLLCSDSELVVRQMNGVYRVKKPELIPLFQMVKQLAASLESFKISHIPREKNSHADSLANKALDTA
jgi:ribonuclease HI